MRVWDTPGLDWAKIIAVGTSGTISAASWSGPDGSSGARPTTSVTEVRMKPRRV